MKPVSEFVANLSEVFTRFGQVEAKRMFGGYGIYRHGHMFALVVDDVLFLKADEDSAPFFFERELSQFEYEKNGKKMRMSYYSAPEEIFDDPEIAKEWADRAYGAAMRAKSPRKKSRAKKK